MTMPTAYGPFSCTEESIADALVRSTWFQKFTKLTFDQESEEAKFAALRQRILFDHIPNPVAEDEFISFPNLSQLRPFVCLWPSQPAGRFTSKAATFTPATGMDFQIYFEAEEGDAVLDVPTINPDKPDELFRWWLNMIGVLLVGDSTLSAKGLIYQQNIDIGRIYAVDLWHVTERPGLGRYYGAQATISMGAGS